MLQDVRITAEDLQNTNNQWWRFRDVDWERVVAPVRWALAPSPQVVVVPNTDKGLKRMGGTLILTWGDVARQSKGERGVTRDKFGRWVAMEVQGEGERATVFVSAYRPPGGGGRDDGGLVARMIKLRGWKGSPSALRKKAKAAFYHELGKLIQRWQEEGKEVVLGADLNEEMEELERWVTMHGLVSIQSKLLETSKDRVGGEEYTYQGGGGRTGSRIDHVMMTKKFWKQGVGRSGRIKTCKVAGMDADHRALMVDNLSWRGCLGKARRGHAWRDLVTAARKAKERAQPPPRVTPERAEEFRSNVTTHLNRTQIESGLDNLEQAAQWGGNLWEGRGETMESCKRVGWEGRLIETNKWEEHVEEYGDAGEGNQIDINEGREWKGDWRGAWGSTCTTVLRAVEKMATRVEGELCTTLVRAATELRHQVIKPRTRRRPNGWFKGIGQIRRGIVLVNRMLAACRERDGKRLRQLMKRGLRNRHLHAWISSVPGEEGENRWKLRTSLLTRRKKGLSMKMQGQARMTARSNMCEALERREKKFKAGNVRGLLNSVLKRARGGDLMEVTDTDGVTYSDPGKAKEVVNTYFEGVFQGKGTDTWYEEEQVGEGVKMCFEDSARGRRAREEGLRGHFHSDWDALQPWQQRLKRMMRFKGGEGERDITSREEEFSAVMTAISPEEWRREWGRKSRYTSAGASGVRPDMIKDGGDHISESMRRLYSACIHLCIIPDQWRSAIVVAIEKEPGVMRVDKLRPLKLMEVTMKGVMGIAKNRVRDVLERLKLLSHLQTAFREQRCTSLSAMNIVGAAEDARKYVKDLHLVTLDIRKAYDSVVRTVGKAMAMRRMGIPLKVVEFLMEADRGNINNVRTFWDAILGDVEGFEALRGFIQGSADAPLLWIIFYDMVLKELEKAGVGKALRMDIGWACSLGGGVGAFADDTFAMANNLVEMQKTLDIIHEVLRVVLLRVAPEKSKHMALMIARKGGGVNEGRWLEEEMIAAKVDHRVRLGGVTVPLVAPEVGLRQLGYWIDLCGDWGEQVDKVKDTIRSFSECVRPARISKEALLYLVQAVLTKQIVYPLVVAAVDGQEIDNMEWSMLKWTLPKLGLHRTYPRKLMEAEVEAGGLGWTRWREEVLRERIRLADLMSAHPDLQIRQMWECMRYRFYEDIRSGRRCLGAGRSQVEIKVENTRTIVEGGWGGGQMMVKSWMGSFDTLLREADMKWDDGWQPRPLREGDVDLLMETSKMETDEKLSAEEAALIRDGIIERDVRWLSQLTNSEGKHIERWDRVGGWEWVAQLATAMELGDRTEAITNKHWGIPMDRRLGEWRNEGHEEDGRGEAQTVWGKGIMVGAWVTTAGKEDRIGVVQQMGTVEEMGRIWVEWREGVWCCSEEKCARCKRIEGMGCYWEEIEPNSWKGLGGEDGGDSLTAYKGSDLTRIWGAEVTASRGRRRCVLWEDCDEGRPASERGIDQPQCWWREPAQVRTAPPAQRWNKEAYEDLGGEQVGEGRGLIGVEMVGWETRVRYRARCMQEEAQEADATEVGEAPPKWETGGRARPGTQGKDWEPDPGTMEELWVIPAEGAAARIQNEWAKFDGGSVIMVTDGGFDRHAPQPDEDMFPQRRAWRRRIIRETSACGWVAGIGGEAGADGGEIGDLTVLGKGGGRERSQVMSRGSSYRSELWGLVCALRAMCGLVVKGLIQRAGPVFHWTDNEGVCKGMANRKVALGSAGLKLKCRDLWAEIKGRLVFWERHGGEWNTEWVQGHVDRVEPDRTKWTCAERGNVEADILASKHLAGGAGGEEGGKLTVVQGALMTAPGGRWWGIDPVTLQAVPWWDDLDSCMRRHRAHRAMAKYWGTRQKNRARQGEEAIQGHPPQLWPTMDVHLQKHGRKMGGKTVKRDIFRSKLWWDHLPSQEVRARGTKGGGGGEEDITVCELCGEAGPGSTWHVLANCKHENLVEARSLITMELRNQVEKVVTGVGRWETVKTCMLESLVETEGCWVSPPGWGGNGAKAGLFANPWYGIFPSQWLDSWCGEEECEAALVDQVAKRLRSLSTVAVEGCEKMWKVAAKIWGERAKSALQAERETAAAQRRAAKITRLKAKLAEQQKAMERSRNSFLRAPRIRQARKAAQKAWEGVIQRGKVISGKTAELKEWAEWSDRRVVEWWLAKERRKKKERAEEKERRQQKKEEEGKRAQRSLLEYWPSKKTNGREKGVRRRRGVGDGADEPG
jgi:hypothetical protein